MFTDIAIPLEYYQDILKRQAIVNAGLRFLLKDEGKSGVETYEYLYENGIADHVARCV